MRCVFCHLLIFCYVITSSADNGGFSTIMYHRDSPDSPFHDPNMTKAERFVKAIDRDFTRINRSLNVIPNTPEAPLKEVSWTYLMKTSLGTPPFEFFARVDTGSELTWIQCHSCQVCHPMHQDVFHPTESSTYRTINCLRGQIPCPRFRDLNCVNNICESHINYHDGSFYKGVLSADVMTIGSKAPHPPVKVKHYVFGCGHYNHGKFVIDQGGIIGLGRGRRSLITQLGTNSNGKFSYCLSKNINGKVNFGHNAIVEGLDTVTTRLFREPLQNPAVYFATLEAMTIGSETVTYTKSMNIFIDSGATLTHFVKPFYYKIVNSVKRQIRARPTKDPFGRLETCFEDIDDTFQFIPMIAHFLGRADVHLNKFNMFQRVGEGVICLAITKGPKSMWGNIAQMNFLVGFDVQAETIKFKPTDCSMT